MIHVTETLSGYTNLGSIDPEILEAAAARGTDVHRFCETYAKTRWVCKVPEDVHGYVWSFKQWFDQWVEKVYVTEMHMTDKALGLTGTLDMVCRLVDGAVALVDYKTPAAPQRVWESQLAAYKLMYEQAAGPVDRCMCLMLRRDGRPAKAIVYTNMEAATAAFLAALNAHRYFKGE